MIWKNWRATLRPKPTKDKKLQKELNQLFARMETVLESYTDDDRPTD